MTRALAPDPTTSPADRDAQTSALTITIVAALTLLAKRLARGEITQTEFTDQSQPILAQAYAQAATAGAAQASADFGLAGDDDWTDAANSRASDASGWLDALGVLIVGTAAKAAAGELLGPDNKTLSPDEAVDQSLGGRIAMYGATTTGAWEDGYTGVVTDALPAARFVWMTSGDANVCDSCAALDGQEFDLDEVGGAGGLPGDADFDGAGCDGGPQCRCWLELTDESAAALAAATDTSVAASGRTTMDPEQTAPITAAAGDAPDWHAILCVEGVRTDDGREIVAGAAQFPDLPVTLRMQIEDEGGHYGAVPVGTIDTMERDGNRIVATGTFSADENGERARLMVGEQTLRFVSIDCRDVEAEEIYISVVDSDDWDDYPETTDYWFRMTKLTIGAATIVAVPAFPQAVIAPIDMALPDTPIADANAPATLAAAGGPMQPPAEWFAKPEGIDRRAVTITDEGRVYGYAALWGTEHIGFPDRRITPPKSHSNYSSFRVASVRTAEGELIPTGVITCDTGHAGGSLNYRDASAHYDNTGTAVADVAVYEDEFGIVYAGALRPGLTDEQVRTLGSSALSGDWRKVGGHLDLVGLLAVNVPGFPIRQSLAASGAGASITDLGAVRAMYRDDEMCSLVAAGRAPGGPTDARFHRLESELVELRSLIASIARERLAARVAS